MANTLKQFRRYFIVGIVSTIINYIFFKLIFLATNLIVLASFFGYIIGLINSYAFCKLWIFNQKNNKSVIEIIKFLFIYAIGGLLNSITIFSLHKLGFNYVLIWFIANGFAFLNNFIGTKFFVFKDL